MKLNKHSGLSYGSTYSAQLKEDLVDHHSVFLRYATYFHAYIRESLKYETDGNKKLETIWYYSVFAGNIAIFKFNCTLGFDIQKDEREPKREDANNVILTSFKNFQKAFENMRIEFSMFESIAQLSDEQIEENLQLLLELLQNV